MDSANWVLALINSVAFLLCLIFTGYVVSVLRPFLSYREREIGDRSLFSWHIMIPCLNEQTVIADTVDHLVETFPEARLWLIDDASDDCTPVLVKWLARRHRNVYVVSRSFPEARLGKGAALNAGWSAICAHVGDARTDTVLVGVVDADGRLEPLCPDVISGPEYFGDSTIGAVQIQVRITQDVDALTATDIGRLRGDRARTKGDPLLVQLQDLEFAGPIAAMQFLRRRTGSVAMGGNGQFTRLSALNRIAAEHNAPWHGTLLEDFELGLHVLLTGDRSEYCHDTFVAQTGLTRHRALLRQRTRWSQGNIQCLKYLWAVANCRHVSIAGLLEIIYYMSIPFTQMLGSLIFPMSAIIQLYYVQGTPSGPDRWLHSGAWGIIPLALIFGILPHAAWGLFYRSHCASLITRRHAMLLALTNLAYSYVLQAAAWRALYRVMRGRNGWAKTARAADQQGSPSREAAEPPVSALPSKEVLHA